MEGDFLEGYDPANDEPVLTRSDAFREALSFIKNNRAYRPIFAYDFLSMKGSDFCFDNPNITQSDYRRIFELKKKVSYLSYEDLETASHKEGLHFHEVESGRKVDYRGKRMPLWQMLRLTLGKPKAKQDSLPYLYQVAVYTDNDKGKAPRLVGFIGRLGVFFALWLDLEHRIYPARK